MSESAITAIGGCSIGYQNDDHAKGNKYQNIYKTQWGYCEECKEKWVIGINIFSSWRYETKENWIENEKFLTDFKLVSG